MDDTCDDALASFLKYLYRIHARFQLTIKKKIMVKSNKKDNEQYEYQKQTATFKQPSS